MTHCTHSSITRMHYPPRPYCTCPEQQIYSQQAQDVPPCIQDIFTLIDTMPPEMIEKVLSYRISEVENMLQSCMLKTTNPVSFNLKATNFAIFSSGNGTDKLAFSRYNKLYVNDQHVADTDSHIESLTFHPEKPLLAVGQIDGLLSILNMQEGKLDPGRKYPAPISSLAYSPNGQHLAIVSSGYTKVHILDSSTLQEQHTLKIPGATSVAYHPTVDQLAIGGAFTPTTGEIQLYNTKNWEVIKTIPTKVPITSISFSSNGRSLAAASEQQLNIGIFNTTTWGVTNQLEVAMVSKVAYSPDGSSLAALSRGTIDTWELFQLEKSPLRRNLLFLWILYCAYKNRESYTDLATLMNLLQTWYGDRLPFDLTAIYSFLDKKEKRALTCLGVQLWETVYVANDTPTARKIQILYADQNGDIIDGEEKLREIPAQAGMSFAIPEKSRTFQPIAKAIVATTEGNGTCMLSVAFDQAVNISDVLRHCD